MAKRGRRGGVVGRSRVRHYTRLPRSREQTGTRILRDSSTSSLSAAEWLGHSGGDRVGGAERRAEDLVRLNQGLLRDMGIEAEVARSRGLPVIKFQTSTLVGAIPLASPITGRPDFGLIVEPRFSWTGVGDVLATTGFRVLPELLPLNELPQSERSIPPWVLASVVLTRLERLLEISARRFVTVTADLIAPKGSVDWTKYAVQRVPYGQLLTVPSRFPDLRDDEDLRSAIHWTVRRQKEELLAAPASGLVARRLMSLADRLIARLAGSPPRRPSSQQRLSWKTHPFGGRVYVEGIDAIDWTLDERGLAGLSDLSGLSWRLNMETFFEGWVESIAEGVASRIGASLKAGRTGDTRVAMDWKPNFAGSLNSLLPDVVLLREDLAIVIDAKYKSHARDLVRLGWRETPETVRERHRSDLHQVLAYAGLFDAPRIAGLLMYPCEPDEWIGLVNRGLDVVTARVGARGRETTLARISVPFGGHFDAVVERVVGEIVA